MTFVMLRLHATLGRTHDENSRLCVKSKKEKQEARTLGPPDSSISMRTEGTTVQVSGDSKVVEKWINGMGPKDRERVESIQRTLQSLWRRKVAYPVAQVGDYVRHVFREHNQEADHLANFDAEWRRERRQYRQLDGGTMNLGREQQDRQKKWMWCCGQRCVQKQVDHNQ